MTTIRRINTSQLDGSNANNNNTNEIRPFGETAFYLDNIGNNDKLTLLMFDGIRTHLRSKVLAPGRLYGSDEDSSDQAGADTIKLIPDANLYYNGGNFGNDQYIKIEPTFPNHIHIRAGGTQDNSNAQLFIGGENSYFSVDDGVNPSLYIAANSSVWTFDGNGNLTIPSGGDIVMDSSSVSTINGVTSITFADNTMQDTAYKLQPLPATPQGKVGDKPGMIAGDSSYLYYCVANYDGSSILWHRVANDGNTGWSNP